MANNKEILIKRSNAVIDGTGKLPQPSDLQYGELAINYASGYESLSFKNDHNEVVTLGMNVKQTTGEDVISPISQKAMTSAIKEGLNNVSTLVNVPVDKRLVYATITQDETLSFDTSKYASCFSAFDKGAQIKVIAFNGTTSSHKIMLPFLDKNYVCFVKSIVVPVNGYGVITVDYDGTSIYVNAKVVERAEGYVGGEAIIALSNASGDIKYAKNSELSTFKAENAEYTPIGIVVIPKTHTQIILKDGDPRKGCNIVMSLKPMHGEFPEEGHTEEDSLYWGYNSKDIAELTNYTVANCYDDSRQNSGMLTTNGEPSLPSDTFTGIPSKVCPSIKYHSEFNLAPSPYKVVDGDWLPNEDYYTTRVSSANALSDFEGPTNTKIITDNATVGDWKSETNVVNDYSVGTYPAACCCARFKTIGTNSFADMLNLNTGGDTKEYWKQTKVWYMPACGELGYIMPNFSANNTALSNISSLYDNTAAVQLDSRGRGYWSSSEYSVDRARLVANNGGMLLYGEKNSGSYVRAFCALPA